MSLGDARVNDRGWLGSGRIALAESNGGFLSGHDHNLPTAAVCISVYTRIVINIEDSSNAELVKD